jgi:hypothetical protein
VYNKTIGGKIDHAISNIKPVSPVMAFQLISATKPLIV